jgi:hypothetical protein
MVKLAQLDIFKEPTLKEGDGKKLTIPVFDRLRLLVTTPRSTFTKLVNPEKSKSVNELPIQLMLVRLFNPVTFKEVRLL